ncbi:MAG: RdgB/HAM1 family non-canonical purine NTP pyrophosphatase [Bacteroidia bacterium]
MMQKLFFGTNNAHKLKEIQEILGEEIQVLSFKDFPPIDVEETEPTLIGNAILKAKAFYEHTQIPCFADDTGLEVAALNGEPGVFSARYAGEHCNPKDNMALLLQNLGDKTDRSAVFKTVIAFYDGQEISLFEGIVKGQIIDAPRGEDGFGYDPIFQPEGYDETFAELPSATKHAISHRGKAVRAFAEFVK